MARRANVCAVTGYVPILNHTRTAKEYGDLAEGFKEMKHDVIPYYQGVDQCWLAPLSKRTRDVQWSKGDNEAKNSLDYHIVNHEKFEWVRRTAETFPQYDSYMWIDYGILRLPGVTVSLIDEFMSRVKPNDLAIPGCWTRLDPRTAQTIESDYSPCWRFCGSMFVVPKYLCEDFAKLTKAVARLRLRTQQKVTWEVNTMAQTEAVTKLPIHWYEADHNARLFTGYQP